ncbi:hypothetical protein MJC1_04237 [Methylocystis sp. MJC1]|jgi:hypothetical protein|nr:hypothetical protein MJC1_04237 [Methylocystis sp. MJC1]
MRWDQAPLSREYLWPDFQGYSMSLFFSLTDLPLKNSSSLD